MKPTLRWTRLCCPLLLAASGGAWAAGSEWPYAGDYGGSGLWQTPSARIAEEGSVGAGVVGNTPYNRLFFSIVPVKGVEAVFRYTDITNRLYSNDPTFSGDQSTKDRGVDLSIRLLEESENLPAIALGLRDAGGTQLFSAQYLVASRRFYDLDFSLGLGWGRLASGGPISNPFSRGRKNASGVGQFSIKSLFASEKVGLFGGVIWSTPIEGLQLLAEYDPNDYQSEPFDNALAVRLPINIGAKYRMSSGITTGLSYQRGRILSLQLGVGFNIASPVGIIPKVLDPQPPRPNERVPEAAKAQPLTEEPVQDVQALARRVETALQKQGITLLGFTLAADAKAAQIWIPPGPYRDSQKLIGRASRAASTALPDSVLLIRVTEVSSGAEIYDADVQRPAMEKAAAGLVSLDEFQRALVVTSPDLSGPEPQYANEKTPQAGWSLNPSIRSSIGGPDSFYFGQVYLKLGGYVNLTPGWSLDGMLGFNIYNNFSDLKLESNSTLPHVRSDIKDYLKEGEQALLRLETNYIHQVSPHLFGRLSAGIFEEMYGGVAGELLYRPSDPRWAVGVNINRVRQRAFNQRFGFRDYEVTTGHITSYFEFPRPSVLVKLSAGQYLAGDRGATLDVSRQFPNGIRVGLYATKTNVSAAQFGEGEFDKGIYLTMPLDTLLPRSRLGSGSFALSPLTRDGGQKVRDGRSLYDITYGAVKARIPLRDNLFFE